jgi:gliding motility-associated-like protein
LAIRRYCVTFNPFQDWHTIRGSGKIVRYIENPNKAGVHPSMTTRVFIAIVLSAILGILEIYAQYGTGLPVWPLAVDGGGNAQVVDWRTSPPTVQDIPNTAPSQNAGGGAAFDGCGNLLFYVLHTGLANVSNNLFIYAADGTPLLTNNTPNGPGLNGQRTANEISVVKVPGIHNEWFIIYSLYESDVGAPNNNGGYVPARQLFSRVRYDSQGLNVLVRDSLLTVNGSALTYIHGKAVSRTAVNPGEHFLYLCRRVANSNQLSLDRFVIHPNGISFLANTGNVNVTWWYLCIAGSFIELSPAEDRVAIINRNQHTNYPDIILFNTLQFSNAPGAYQIITLRDLILQPDGIVHLTPKSIYQTSLTNPNLAFLTNLEKKVAHIEFSPNGRFLYFGTGGFHTSGYSHANYLGQIDLGPVSQPANYPYDVRLQIEAPPGTMNMSTGTGAQLSSVGSNWKPIRDIQSCFDGRLYFSKQNTDSLYVIPFPDMIMPQQLIPGWVDLSDQNNPNIAVSGQVYILPESIDGLDYVSQNPDLVNLGPDTFLCQGDSLLLDAFLPGANYVWQDSTSSPTYTVTQSGSYWVEVEVDSCFDYDTIVVGMLPAPQVDLGNDTILCDGDTLWMNAAWPGATYVWQDASIDSVMTGVQAGLYWVEVSLGSCSAHDSLYLQHFPFIPLDLGPDTAVCTGDTLVLDVGMAGATYAWENGYTGALREITQAGLYHVTVSQNACQAKDSLWLNLLPVPEVDLGADTQLCANEVLELNAAWPGATYLWQNGHTDSILIATQAGLYTVTVSLGPCTASDDKVIGHLPVPLISLGTDTGLCQGDSLLLDATYPGASYLWQDGSQGATYTVYQAGDYHITVTANTCSASDTISVFISPAPEVNLGNDTSVCQGEEMEWNAGWPGATYLWQDGSKDSVFQSNAAGTYWVELSLGFCQAADTVHLSLRPLPLADLGPDQSICPGDTLMLSALQAGASYLWSDGSSGAQLAVNNAGTYWVEVDLEECIASDTILLHPLPEPFINLGNDTLICEGDRLLLVAPDNFASYLWSDGASGNTLPVQTAGIWWLEVFDGCYSVRDSIEIHLESCQCALWVPNAFTPNGDGVNDYFEVKGECVAEYQIRIFDRWGQQVFHSTDLNKAWDGYLDGSLCPMDVYAYRIDYTLQYPGEEERKTGSIVLLY